MTEQDATVEEVAVGDDKFELKDDGTIVIGWDALSFTLRRPRLGEFRKLKEATKSENRDEDDDLMNERWMALAFKMLSPHPLPKAPKNLDEDERPVWLLDNAAVVHSMFAHWRSVPLGRG